MTRFIIFGSTDEYLDYFMSDIAEDPDVVFLNRRKEINNPLMKQLCKICIYIEKKIPWASVFMRPFHNHYFKYITDYITINKEDNNVFVIYDVRAFAFDGAFLQYLRNHMNGRIVIIFSNPINKTPYRESIHRKYYDILGVFDKESAQKYDALCLQGCYQPIEIEASEYSDLFFIGLVKGRLDLLHRVFCAAKSQGLKCNFYLVGVNKDKELFPNEIHYNQRLSYKEVVSRVKGSKCVLEILQPEVTGSTLRATEAIVYEKRLITNNPSISNVKCYNSKYMKYMENPEEFDFRFILDSEPVKYEKISRSFRTSLELFRKELGLE